MATRTSSGTELVVRPSGAMKTSSRLRSVNRDQRRPRERVHELLGHPVISMQRRPAT